MITTAKELGTVLGIWGHPDDEAYLSSGVMAGAVEAGHRVVCVTATRGELGFPDDDPRPLAERAALREAELEECFAILGVTEHRWLDYGDGTCGDVDIEEVVGELIPIIEELRPDSILTFPPAGGTGHVDHIAASRWATIAHRRAAVPNARLYYSVRTPEWEAEFEKVIPRAVVMMSEVVDPPTPRDELAVDLEFDESMVDRKVRALRAHASQVEGLLAMSGLDAFTRLMAGEFFRESTDADFRGER